MHLKLLYICKMAVILFLHQYHRRDGSLATAFAIQWIVMVVMLTTFSSLAALEVVMMTTSSVASDEKVINMTTFPFQ